MFEINPWFAPVSVMCMRSIAQRPKIHSGTSVPFVGAESCGFAASTRRFFVGFGWDFPGVRAPRRFCFGGLLLGTGGVGWMNR